MGIMDIDNDPIVSDKELLFCEDGNRLAMSFLDMSRSAVKLAGTAPNMQLRFLVNTALDALLSHRGTCEACANDGSDPAPPPRVSGRLV